MSGEREIMIILLVIAIIGIVISMTVMLLPILRVWDIIWLVITRQYKKSNGTMDSAVAERKRLKYIKHKLFGRMHNEIK